MDFNATRAELGEGIREWRRRRHLTQEELAAAAKVHVNALGEGGAGQGQPDLESVVEDRNEIESHRGAAALGTGARIGADVFAI